MKKIVIVLMIISLITVGGCRDKKKVNTVFRSMEQIHKTTGVPVKTEIIQTKEFNTSLKYFATLQARSEAVGYSRVADVVQQVFVKVGDYVRVNQTVITFPKSNQTSHYYQLKASCDLAERTYRRMQQLYNEGVISKQELDNTRANYEVARANVNVTDDLLCIKAPISGYITQLNVKPTDNVDEEAPLFTVSNLDLIEAQIWVSSNEINRIKLCQKVTLEWNGQKIEGSISQVSKIMDAGRKAFEVKALFKNGDKLLTSGITADISIEIYSNQEAVIVERKQLIKEDGHYYVFVVKNGKALKREVAVGVEQGILVEVKGGLKPGDILIVEGAKTVTNQCKVKVVNS